MIPTSLSRLVAALLTTGQDSSTLDRGGGLSLAWFAGRRPGPEA